MRLHFCSAGLLAAALSFAPPPAPAAAAAGSNAVPPSPVPAPPVPMLKSPVDFFRELMAMSRVEREKRLADRPAENRKQIEAKVREYEALRPDERELRLRVTDLRWYLVPLMKTPATNRPAQLALIPEANRAMVESRLQEWDKLPAAAQQELWTNAAAVQYFAEPGIRAVTNQISPARRQMLEKGIRDWQALPEGQRQKIMSRFEQFFDLTDQEQQKALNTLSDTERRQIAKTLQKFEKLSPSQRAQCIRSFDKFANMSLEERQQFLKNSERWKLMSPAERQGWRELVNTVPMLPPPPPALQPPPPPMPTVPRKPPPTLVTNY